MWSMGGMSIGSINSFLWSEPERRKKTQNSQNFYSVENTRKYVLRWPQWNVNLRHLSKVI